jgi:hypothetical protein
MKTILKVLIDTDGANCGARCRFLDSVVSSCTLFGGLDETQPNTHARHANCVKCGVDATSKDLARTVKGRGQLVRVGR